ncbi:MAG TPA: hypothetical protein PKB10_12345, partial [Tepidisphaeraceae bacterium]|nr:hypothetical protein [Tepidisphaeraceae bacterium]
GIQHEVLNAKQHEREAHIVEHAGLTHTNAHGEVVGNVTIATNMAGRGTDIKPAPNTFFEILEAKPGGKSEYTYTLRQRGSDKTIDVVDPNDLRRAALQLEPGAKVVGGLHVIGTERHTARRIDNQLRGRSGRQGDAGSSRFYVSLQDDLMKMFAGDWTIKVLGFLGMKEGEAIEDRRITKGIERAQRKVEERNFLARKNLLDYDEVMDHQRTSFYGMRQQVLEGRDVDQLIWQMIGESIEDAVDKYIRQDYVAANIADWARSEFDVTIEAEDIKGMRRYVDLEDLIKNRARTDVETNLIEVLREFMGEDPDDNSQWDHKELSSWAMSKYRVQISQAQLKKMSAHEVEETLKEAAIGQIEARDCAGIQKFLEPGYAPGELAAWAKNKFDVDVTVEEILGDVQRGIAKPLEEIVDLIEARARENYRKREVSFPVENALVMAFGPDMSAFENAYAVDYVRGWAKVKYDLALGIDEVRALGPGKLREKLMDEQERFIHGSGIEQAVDALMKEHTDPEALAKAFGARFGERLTAADIDPRRAVTFKGTRESDRDGDGSVTTRDILLRRARNVIRRELSQLEQYLLISILDQAWKDHLYAMDMLRTGIGLQAFAERDPRIQYKKEGFRYFTEMMRGVRARVTDLIFHVHVGGPTEARSAYKVTAEQHETTDSYGVSETIAQAPSIPQAQAGEA